jgi:uncharacterized coiled-coil protein SlyX
MKNKAYLVACVSAIVLGSCSTNPVTVINSNDDIKKITAQRDSVIQISNQKDSSINAFISSFSEIENNLVSIRQKEEFLSFHSKKNVELRGDIKNEINENIKIINDLMDKNRRQITSLNTQLKKANNTIGQLKGLIDVMALSINYKNEDLAELNRAFATQGKIIMALNTSMIDLGIQDAQKTDTINKINAKLNTAYYIINDGQQLREKKIVTLKGGFFSPNQYEKVNPDFNIADFTKINIKQTNQIKIDSKTAKIVTTHPIGSYKLETDNNDKITNLVITNADKFWSESKFLVIVTN